MKQKLQKGLVNVLILGLVVVTIAIGAFAYLKQPSKMAPPINPTPTPFDETVYTEATRSVNTEQSRSANWKTYRNEEYGFEVRYPEDFIDSPKGTNEILFTKKETFDNPMITFYDPKPESRELLIWSISIDRKTTLDSFCKDWADSSYTKKNILLNGFSAARCTNINLYRTNAFVAIPKNNDLIIFTLYYDQYEYLSTFDQILSTFRFLDNLPE